jgi:hypothetical protein
MLNLPNLIMNTAHVAIGRESKSVLSSTQTAVQHVLEAFLLG